MLFFTTKGLGWKHDNLRGNILAMDPLPTINKEGISTSRLKAIESASVGEKVFQEWSV